MSGNIQSHFAQVWMVHTSTEGSMTFVPWLFVPQTFCSWDSSSFHICSLVTSVPWRHLFPRHLFHGWHHCAIAGVLKQFGKKSNNKNSTPLSVSLFVRTSVHLLSVNLFVWMYVYRALFRKGATGAWHPWYFVFLCNGTREFFRNFWFTVALHPWNSETFNLWHPWIEIPKEGPGIPYRLSLFCTTRRVSKMAGEAGLFASSSTYTFRFHKKVCLKTVWNYNSNQKRKETEKWLAFQGITFNHGSLILHCKCF